MVCLLCDLAVFVLYALWKRWETISQAFLGCIRFIGGSYLCDQVMLFSALNDFITARSIIVYRFSHLFKFQYIVFDCVARWFARKVRHKTRVFSSPICMKVKSAMLMNAALLSDAWELFSFPKLAWINRFPVHSLPDIWPSCTPKQTWSLFRCLIT